MARYEVKLLQKEYINTETFEYEAADETAAMSLAEQFVKSEKDLTGVDYKFEAVLIEEPVETIDGEEVAAAQPAENE